MDIKTNIKNYKLCKNYELDVKDANLIIISAANERGKSSLITAHKELIGAKRLTPDPLTHGSEDGSIFSQLPDKNGNPVTVSILIDKEGQYAFTLIDHLGKKITQQTKIREILGYSTFLTIDEFTRKCQNAKGKREIMEQIIYKLLPENEQVEILKIDKQLTTESELYKSIHNLKKELESSAIQQEALKLTEEENIIASQSEAVDTTLDSKKADIAKYEEEAKSIALYDSKLSSYNQKKEQLAQAEVNLETWKIKKLKEIEDEYLESLNEISEQKKANIEPTKVVSTITEEKYNQLKEEVDVITKSIGKRDMVAEKVAKLNALKLSIAPKQKTLLEKEKEKEDLKNNKLAILQKVDIPSLTFDEETFYIDGMEISETQVSESKIGLILIELLCRKELNETPIVFFGNMSIFDKNRAREVINICLKYGKIPVFEKVGTTDDIRIITNLEDAYPDDRV